MSTLAAWQGGGRSGPHGMRGITLIELMVVIVIVGILVAIAYPGYQSQIQKTRRSEGTAALLDTAQRLERCFTRFNAYNHASCDIAATVAGAGVATEQGFYLITDAAAFTASTFSLIATRQGAQTDDTLCGNLTLDNRGTQGRTGTAPLDTCW